MQYKLEIFSVQGKGFYSDQIFVGTHFCVKCIQSSFWSRNRLDFIFLLRKLNIFLQSFTRKSNIQGCTFKILVSQAIIPRNSLTDFFDHFSRFFIHKITFWT